MTVRSLMRQEFPRGWWRSLRWWVSGSLGLLCSMLAAVAAVVFIADVLRLLRHRDEPDVVASARVPFEGYLAGALLGCLGLGIALEVLVIRWPLDIFMSVLLGGVIVWCVAHMLVCGTACVVTVRSWLRAPRAWADIDFVSKNLPPSRPAAGDGRGVSGPQDVPGQQVWQALTQEKNPAGICPRGSSFFTCWVHCLMPVLPLTWTRDALSPVDP